MGNSSRSREDRVEDWDRHLKVLDQQDRLGGGHELESMTDHLVLLLGFPVVEGLGLSIGDVGYRWP